MVWALWDGVAADGFPWSRDEFAAIPLPSRAGWASKKRKGLRFGKVWEASASRFPQAQASVCGEAGTVGRSDPAVRNPS